MLRKIQERHDMGYDALFFVPGKWRDVFTAMKIYVMVFWVVINCNDVVWYRRFGGSYCLNLHTVLQPKKKKETTIYFRNSLLALSLSESKLETYSYSDFLYKIRCKISDVWG
jgi:hypothetical protein